MDLHRVALIVAFLVVHLSPASGRECLSPVAQLPHGPAYAVAGTDPYVYFGSGTVLVVAEAVGGDGLQLVGEVALSGVVRGVAVADDHICVAAGDAGLRVIDVSNPSEPIEIGHHEPPPDSSAVAVALGQDHVYVAAGRGLQVFDMTIPTTPVEVAYLELPTYYPVEAMVADGDRVYVAAANAGLRIIDVGTPSTPVELGFYELWIGSSRRSARDVAVADGIAHVLFGGRGLHSIDVTTPSAPVEVGSLRYLGYPVDLAAAGGYVYLLEELCFKSASMPFGCWELRIIDVTDPSMPVTVGSHGGPGGAGAVAVAGDHAYVLALAWFSLAKHWPSSQTGEGLIVVDVSEPSAPVRVGFLDTGVSIGDLTVKRGLALIMEPWRLRVVDVSTSSDPFVVAEVDTPDWSWGVAVEQGYAYVANGHAGLLAIDVSVPEAPAVVASHDTPGEALGVAVARGHVFVADGDGGFRVFRGCGSRPATPRRPSGRLP